jgi:uncharacterized protein (UPF0248 family)
VRSRRRPEFWGLLDLNGYARGVMRTLALALYCALNCVPTFAQTAADQPRVSLSPISATSSRQSEADEIRRRVKQEQKIVVTDDQGRRLTGRVAELKADALILNVRGDRTHIPYDRIVRIDRPDDRLWDGALAGFAVGAGLGLLGAAASSNSEGFGPDPGLVAVAAPVVLGGIGAAIGVGVDALIHREPTLYRRQTTASISLSRTQKRIAISVAW